jgi:CopG family nickel-responsive transcriptional regulator
MCPVDRFSVSLDTELLAAFDRHIADRGYGNRSEAIRDMIRDALIADVLQRGDEPVAVVLSVVCDRRQGPGATRLRDCLATDRELVAGSLSVPIDDHRESMAIGLKGPAGRVQALADRIRALRGVAHGHVSAAPLSV